MGVWGRECVSGWVCVSTGWVCVEGMGVWTGMCVHGHTYGHGMCVVRFGCMWIGLDVCGWEWVCVTSVDVCGWICVCVEKYRYVWTIIGIDMGLYGQVGVCITSMCA